MAVHAHEEGKAVQEQPLGTAMVNQGVHSLKRNLLYGAFFACFTHANSTSLPGGLSGDLSVHHYIPLILSLCWSRIFVVYCGFTVVLDD